MTSTTGPYPGKPIDKPDIYQDRTVQDWHRTHFPPHHWAIDLDLAGICNKCLTVLYLIESTCDKSKKTGILRELGKKSRTPALLIEHHHGQITKGVELYPEPSIIGGQLEIENHIFALREQHALACEKASRN